MNILVSACLLGEPCRYDGKSKPDERVMALSNEHNLIPVCPERDGGLSIPRDPCERIGDKVLTQKGKDCTKEYTKGAEIALDLCRKHNCKYAVLKLNSPSCGCRGIYDGTFTRTLVDNKKGVAAELLSKNGIIVLGEDQTDKIGK